MNQKHYTLVLAIGFLVCACSRAPAPDVLDLLMPLDQAAGVQRIQHKSVLVPDRRGVGAQSPQDMAALEGQNIQSSAYFKYWLDDKRAYKVRINVYSDAKARRAGWNRRYPPETLTRADSLGLGETSFLQDDKIGGFASHTALVEISGSKGAKNLEAFIRRYAAYVEQQF